MATLITVLKSGGRYDALWVERLNAGARRSVPGIHRVVCLTDLELDVDGVEVIPLRHGWPAWWSKFEAFRPDIADDLTILCDLDTVFTGDAQDLADDSTAAMEDYFLKGRLSTALLRWRGREFDDLYEAFSKEPEGWMQPGSCGTVPNSVHGDQVVVDHLLRRDGRLPDFLQNRHPGLLDFYDPTRADQGPVIIFIGDSKPDTATQALREVWSGTVAPRTGLARQQSTRQEPLPADGPQGDGLSIRLRNLSVEMVREEGSDAAPVLAPAR